MPGRALQFRRFWGTESQGGEIMMDREALRATLVELLEEEMGEEFELSDESTELREGLGLDSVDVVGLVMRVEGQFRIRLAMEELMEVKQLGQLLDLVEGKLALRPFEEPSAAARQPTAA
jgi:acyl carrier protein